MKERAANRNILIKFKNGDYLIVTHSDWLMIGDGIMRGKSAHYMTITEGNITKYIVDQREILYARQTTLSVTNDRPLVKK